MRSIIKAACNPVVIALLCIIALPGCAPQTDNLETLSVNAPSGSVKDFVSNAGDRIFFDQDSSTISGDGQQILMRQADWLRMYPQYSMIVEGHSDERDTREYNMALGQRRAVAVRTFLVEQGIEQSRITTVSYGKERPVATCNDETCWEQNRRTVIVLHKQENGKAV